VSDKNLATLFQNRIYRHGSLVGMSYKQDGRWLELSWHEIGQRIKELGRALLFQGVEPGHRVAVYGENRPESAWVDLATLSIGAVNLSIDGRHPLSSTLEMLRRTESSILFVSGKEREQKVNAERSKLPALRHVISLEESAAFSAFRSSGRSVPASRFFERLEKIETDSPALLFGDTRLNPNSTTSNSDPVVCPQTHGMLLSACETFAKDLPAGPTDTCFSLMPLGPALERVLGLYSLLEIGTKIVFPTDPQNPLGEIKESQPTLLLSLPRQLEMLYHHFCENLAEHSRFSRYLIEKNLSPKLQDPPKSFSRFVLPKIRQQFGGKLERILLSGAPLSPRIRHFFQRMGVTMKELPTDEKRPSLVESWEADLRAEPLINEASVFQSPGKPLVVLIVPNFRVLEKRARSERIQTNYRESLLSNTQVQKWYSKLIEDLNSSKPIDSRIARLELLPREFSYEEGEILPPYTLDRDWIQTKHPNLISRMYGMK